MRGRRVINHLPVFTGPLMELAELGNSGPLLRDQATDIYLPTAELKTLSPLEVLMFAEEASRFNATEIDPNKHWTAALFATRAVKRISETADRLGRFRERSQASEAVRSMTPFIIGAALHLKTAQDFSDIQFGPSMRIKDVEVTERTPEEMASYIAKHEGSYSILRPIMGSFYRHELPIIRAGGEPITAVR